jgi:hypothetical protein
MSLGAGVDKLSTLVQLRLKTDVRVGSRWILLAIASYILWILFAISSHYSVSLPLLTIRQSLGLIGTLAFAASTGLSFLVYSLINRQNKHSAREQELAWQALREIQSRTAPENLGVLLPLSATEHDFSNLLERSHEHSAFLWSLLVLVPYVGWVFLMVALYLLTESSNAHGRMERILFEDLGRTLAAEGRRQPQPNSRLPDLRNSTAYLLASAFTLGIVALSWLYVMIIGEAAHFRDHSTLEPELLRAFPESTAGGGRAA